MKKMLLPLNKSTANAFTLFVLEIEKSKAKNMTEKAARKKRLKI